MGGSTSRPFQDVGTEAPYYLCCSHLRQYHVGPVKPMAREGLWPLIAVRLEGGRVEEAIAAAFQLLGPDQQRFAEQLESAVQSALDAWDEGEAALAPKRRKKAVGLACRLRCA